MVPVLSKYSSLTIGATLIAIGVLGLRETLAEGAGQEAEPAQDTMVAAIPSSDFCGHICHSASSDQYCRVLCLVYFWTYHLNAHAVCMQFFRLDDADRCVLLPDNRLMLILS